MRLTNVGLFSQSFSPILPLDSCQSDSESHAVDRLLRQSAVRVTGVFVVGIAVVTLLAGLHDCVAAIGKLAADTRLNVHDPHRAVGAQLERAQKGARIGSVQGGKG